MMLQRAQRASDAENGGREGETLRGKDNQSERRKSAEVYIPSSFQQNYELSAAFSLSLPYQTGY